jgi:hypothetical protein
MGGNAGDIPAEANQPHRCSPAVATRRKLSESQGLNPGRCSPIAALRATLAWLRSKGCRSVGYSGWINWSHDGEETASIV